MTMIDDDGNDGLEDSLEEAVFIPLQYSSTSFQSNRSKGQAHQSDSMRNSRTKTSTINPQGVDHNRYNIWKDDDDELQDSLNSNKPMTKTIGLMKTNSFTNRNHEAILIQKIFRGYQGRKIAVKQQLLSERARLRSKALKRNKNSSVQNRSIIMHTPRSQEWTQNIQFETIPIENGGQLLIQRISQSKATDIVEPVSTTIRTKMNEDSYRTSDNSNIQLESISPTLVRRDILNSKVNARSRTYSDEDVANDPLEDSLNHGANKTSVHRSQNHHTNTQTNREEYKDTYNELYDSLEKSNLKEPSRIAPKQSPRKMDPESRDLRKAIVKEKVPVTDTAPKTNHIAVKPPPSLRDLMAASKLPPSVQPINAPVRATSENSRTIVAKIAATYETPTAINPRMRIMQQQARRNTAAITVQRVYRGYKSRVLAKKRRERIVDKYVCWNCKRHEISGEYCKGCGRPRRQSSFKANISNPQKVVPLKSNDEGKRPINPYDRVGKLSEKVNAIPLMAHNVIHDLPKRDAVTRIDRPTKESNMRLAVRDEENTKANSKQTGNLHMDSTYQLQLEENKLMNELAAIDRLQQKKMHDLRNVMERALPSPPSNNIEKKQVANHTLAYPLPKKKLESKPYTTENIPKVSSLVAEEKAPRVNYDSKPNATDLQKYKRNNAPPKEKLAFTVAAKDYKHEKSERKQQEPHVHHAVVPDDKYVDEYDSVRSGNKHSQAAKECTTNDLNKPSLLSAAPIIHQKNIKIAQYDDGGYLSEFRRRSLSAGKARNSNKLSRRDIDDDSIQEIKSEGGYRSKADHDYETISLPSIRNHQDVNPRQVLGQKLNQQDQNQKVKQSEMIISRVDKSSLDGRSKSLFQKK